MGLPPLCGLAHKVTPKKHSFQWDVRSAQAMVFHNIRHSLILISLTLACGVVAFPTRVHAAQQEAIAKDKSKKKQAFLQQHNFSSRCLSVLILSF